MSEPIPDMIDTFTNLSRSSKFSSLRPWQETFSEIWKNGAYKNSRIGIKLPTGCGKTLIALLILETYRTKDPPLSGAIITHNYALIDKIKDEADNLGIPAVIIRGKSAETDLRKRNLDIMAYQNCEAIRISPYAVELYSDVNPPDVLIIDDADMFANDLRESCVIHILKEDHEELYNNILGILNPENYEKFESINQGKEPSWVIRLVYVNEAIKAQNYLIENHQKIKKEYKKY